MFCLNKNKLLPILCLSLLLQTLCVYAEDKRIYVDGDVYVHKGGSLTRSAGIFGEGVGKAIKRMGIKRKVKEYIKNCNDTALGLLPTEEAMKVIVSREGACKRK